ncbi:MAG TPA: sigma-54 dependent transcriptional regulator [Longimicrobiales bacterium]|nr:sigma-54 dependent transcriptional regulator [Longimicrobiales bacterium]
MPSVLIVDDEANIRRMLGRLLQEESYHTAEADSGRRALEQADAEDPDVVLLDLAMPGMSGMEVLRALRERRPELPVVMISGRATLQDAVEATKLGAFHFIEKPLTPEAVLMTVKGAVELRRARDLSSTLRQRGSLRELVGESEVMARTRELIQQAAPTEARVLLTGESGTGKELAAEALHSLSRRAAGPFVRVNSAAIPRELIESEMFGHEKGAFTGATARRRGRFELADGGTLFLDEVAELGPEAQAKLLRALEAGEIERVGGGRPIPVDVRVIAATNRDLDREMQAGRFRQDLYYRLNVLPIRLPPLRDRTQDIPALVKHLSKRLRERQGMDPPTFDDEVFDRLRRYDWPGNVRELANVCERLAILYPGSVVGAAEIAPVIPATGESNGSLTDRLDAEERRMIQDALHAAAGNVAEAARSLDTDRPNLYRRMRRLGIDR